ncbi:MAG: RsmD family RNA methyltransferase [Gemmataceae bacterium]|nr:RsmD family RNA methyltransferase [Gemmataceae bacterium]MCI0741329.1 RsmD family RNA methyltransferase [Gemmataceae bacterium]
MQVTLRIVAGSLRGRKLICHHNPDLRPTPQMVREAFFSILGNAVPGRVFVDVFAGTGIVGLEALSRGAAQTIFVERDLRLAGDIDKRLREFGLAKQAKLYRTDAYRWATSWLPSPFGRGVVGEGTGQLPSPFGRGVGGEGTQPEPVNVFFSPPFADLEHRTDDLLQMIRTLQEKVAPDSVLVVQAERDCPLEKVLSDWETRKYGRNLLMIWQKENQESGVSNQDSGTMTPDA